MTNLNVENRASLDSFSEEIIEAFTAINAGLIEDGLDRPVPLRVLLNLGWGSTDHNIVITGAAIGGERISFSGPDIYIAPERTRKFLYSAGRPFDACFTLKPLEKARNINGTYVITEDELIEDMQNIRFD